MPTACFRFYGELNDFLPASCRQGTLVSRFERAASVKDLVEALGVPHPEIGWLVVNGQAVGFEYLVRDGDRVAAYPPFVSADLAGAGGLAPAAQDVPRFVADVHLGRLAAYLRLAGFDTRYRNDAADPELVAVSAGEDRTLLTRDVALLKHAAVRRGYFVRETSPARQLVEVLRRFDLVGAAAPFTRCVRCNERLRAVDKHLVEHLVPERTREFYADYSRCPACLRIYWAGSHHARMTRFLEEAFAAAGRKRDQRQ